MSLVELVKTAANMTMVDEDGAVEHLQLSPPLALSEITALEQQLPCALPQDVRELLLVARGFANGPLESLEFAGLPGGFGMEEIFSCPLAIAHDGFGNYWIADLHAGSTAWGPILYACHDPPVLVYQTASFEHFLKEVLRFANPPHASEINDVHEQAATQIWADNPGAIPASQLRASADPDISAFVAQLSDAWFVVDLRAGITGSGFSWGRFGPQTKVVRYRHELLFAYEGKTRWQRWFCR